MKTLPEWSDRITARSGGPREIIVRVPQRDNFGNWKAVNHIISPLEAVTLAMEINLAISEDMINPHEPTKSYPHAK